MTWKGVIIEESMEDGSLLEMVTETGYSESLMEGEDDVHHFHEFEIDDGKKDTFISVAKEIIKDGWYTHICNNGQMIVIFKNKVFEFSQGESEKIEAARNYGLSIGIIREQMPFEQLIINPFD